MDDAYAVTAMRYVERNPIRAKTTQVPWTYRWSSAAAHTGRPDPAHLLLDLEVTVHDLILPSRLSREGGNPAKSAMTCRARAAGLRVDLDSRLRGKDGFVAVDGYTWKPGTAWFRGNRQ